LILANIYANENFPLAITKLLRSLGHNVLTSLEAGRANLRIPDEQVLEFAASQRRILVTLNRRDFHQLHNAGKIVHAGLILCTADKDFTGLAQRIHQAISHSTLNPPFLIRINKPNKP